MSVITCPTCREHVLVNLLLIKCPTYREHIFVCLLLITCSTCRESVEIIVFLILNCQINFSFANFPGAKDFTVCLLQNLFRTKCNTVYKRNTCHFKRHVVSAQVIYLMEFQTIIRPK